MESCHLLLLRNKGYSDALGSSLGNCHFTAHLLALNLTTVIFNREELSSLLPFPAIVGCLAWRTMDFKAMYGDFAR